MLSEKGSNFVNADPVRACDFTFYIEAKRTYREIPAVKEFGF
jgi:hypothetical protein